MKVLILQSHISSYNVPVYELLSKKMKLTVAYSINDESKGKQNFNKKKLEFSQILGLKFMKQNFRRYCESFDTVIFMADLHYISFWLLPFGKRSYNIIPWSIGVRASYKRKYSLVNKGVINLLYGKLMNRCDSIIFYTENPISSWKGIIDPIKIFVAHNTTEVLQTTRKEPTKLLFIGSLYREKMIYELIEAFEIAKQKLNKLNFYHLNIIGGGPEYGNIQDIIFKKNLNESISLHGPIYDEEIISNFFSDSILCISPNQAGLSVLKSMGYGVPFVTRKDAITGGEIFNITHEINGLLYDSKTELVEILIDSFLNHEKYITMGNKAKEHYQTKATISNMANGFIDAINYCNKLKSSKLISRYA